MMDGPRRILAEAAEEAADPPLVAPVAFPIFRPPLETVQRQKTSVESIRPLRFHSIPSSSSTNLTGATEVEEISAPSDSFSSPEEEEEEDASSSHAHAEGEFSSVPTVTIQLGNDGNGSRSSGAESSGEMPKKNGSMKAKTKGPMKMNKSGGGGIEPILATTPSGAANVESSSQSSRPFHRAQSSSRPGNGVSIINTPQFPVFTGMGMEIIDSHEGNDESTVASSTVGGQKGDDRHKMHYQRADNGGNGSDKDKGIPIQLVHLSTLPASGTTKSAKMETTTTTGWPQSTTSTTKPEQTERTTEVTTTRIPSAFVKTTTTQVQSAGNVTSASIGQINTSSTSPISLEKSRGIVGGIGEEQAFKTEASAKMPAIPSTTSVPIPADEVTEDLLALLNKKSGSSPPPPPLSPPPLPASAESNDQLSPFHNIGLNGKDELDSGFERQTQIAGGGGAELGIPVVGSSTARLPPNGEEVLTRPTRPPTSTTEPPPVTSSTRVFTRFPILWTSSTQKPLETVTTTTATPRLDNNAIGGGNFNGGFGQNWRPISTTEGPPVPPPLNWGRISPSVKAATTTEWPMSNHLEEEEEHEREGPSSPSPNGVENGQMERKEEAVGEQMQHGDESKTNGLLSSSSKYSTHPANANHLRMLIMAAVILALLVTVVVGSICTARYVKKSRQLHGKYRPAAYEMQTQQRFQPDYVQHIPMQQQTAIFNGKEERLI